MLRIDCPHCGPRAEFEFACAGESHIERPQPDVSDAVWGDYLFFRDNPKGVTFERWHHHAGCHRWFNVARDTVSHDILAVYTMGAAKPDIGSA